MSDEIEYFNVKNKSLRLVHIGGVSIPPEKVVAIVNDPKGINKNDVETSEYLEETDEEVNWPLEREEVEVVKSKAKVGKSANVKNTASGAGWNTGNKS